ncbi:MAG: penicillin acylase family protein [Spirochaetota bacterium]
MKKQIIRHLIIISCISLFSLQCALVHNHFKKSLLPFDGTIRMGCLEKPVTVKRDSLGIPCIQAENESDLFCATGYVTASYRLTQMVILKHAIQGRLSEIAGSDTLPIDRFMRSLGVKAVVDNTMKQMDEHGRMMLKSFARGVNHYMHTTQQLPPELVLSGFTPHRWKPEDSLYIFAMLNLNVSFNLIEELHFLIIAHRLGYKKAAELFPVYHDQKIPLEEAEKLRHILPELPLSDMEELQQTLRKMETIARPGTPASNNWALAPSRTKGGKSIIANDTHLMLALPSPWIILHLECPTYRCAGVTLPGIPVITAGFNGNIAWGETMVMADSQDLFIERIKEDGGKLFYLFRDKWLPLKKRTETFNIKGKDPLTLPVYETHHGPLLNHSLSQMPLPPEIPVQPLPVDIPFGLSLSWVVKDGDVTLDAFYRLGRASTMKEARNAISGIHSIYLNIIYGDKKNIGWQVTGLYPLRKKGKGLFPSPGWTGEHEWQGFAPFSSLPHSENPSAGYLCTANHRTVEKNYPLHMSSSWYNQERAQRLEQVLSSTKNATVDHMKKLQNDRYSTMARKVQEILFSTHRASFIQERIDAMKPVHKRNANRALYMLHPDRFDCIMEETSPAAALMGALYHAFTRATFLDELGPEDSLQWEAFIQASMTSYAATDHLLVYRERSVFFDNINTPALENKYDILAQSLNDAYTLCRKEMGVDEEQWKWGTLHTYNWQHDISKKTGLLKGYLDRGPFPAGGDVHTVNVAGFTWGKNFDVWMIPAMRMIVDFNSKNPMHIITTPGESGHPSSPHYDDMIPYFLEGRYQVLPLSHDTRDDHYIFRQTLTP